MITEAQVWSALAEVEDPEIPVVSLVDLGVVPPELRPELARRVGLDVVEAKERGEHTPALVELWEEMTEVRRSAPGAEW